MLPTIMKKLSRELIVTVFALLILVGVFIFGVGKFAGNQQAAIVGSTNKTVVLQDGLVGYSGTADTYIYSFPTHDVLNFGNSAELRSSSVEKYNFLVRFKILQSEGGPIPNNAIIASAKLSLYKFSSYDTAFAAYRVKKDWLETEATWLRARQSILWTKPGEITSDDFITAPDGSTNIGWNAGWLTIDVTSGVHAFAKGEVNAGWEIIGVSGNSNTKTFYSRESGTAALRPKLEITYILDSLGLTATDSVTANTANTSNTSNTQNASNTQNLLAPAPAPASIPVSAPAPTQTSAPSTVSTIGISIGDFVSVYSATVKGNLNVRVGPGLTKNILGTQPIGSATGKVIGGPVKADGYLWWQIDYTTGADGWSVQNYLIRGLFSTPSTSGSASGSTGGTAPPPPTSVTPPPAPTPSTSGLLGQISIPLNKWIALRAPYPYSSQGITSANKHVTGSYHPPSGRIYFEGGDYAGKHGNTGSYRQETWSLSIAERFADKNNSAAGWRLEYPYCGPVGQIQPKHPDYVGWVWDQKRGLFYMVPGVMESTTMDNCPGETADKVTNPGFIANKMMSFNPVTKLWAIMGDAGAYAQDTWMSVLDPVTDSLIRFDIFGVGRGSIYNLTTNTWSTFSMPSISLWKEELAVDIPGRLIYAIDGYRGKLWSFNIDSKAFTDLGPVPGGAINYDNVTYLVWDSTSKVLLWHKEGTAFNAYHPDTKKWETLSVASDIPGVNARGRHGMTYDPGQNVVFLFGGSVTYDENPYIFLYRYGSGGGPTADTIAPTQVSGLSASAFSSSQINLVWSASTDNVDVAGYRIYRGGVQIATSNVTSYKNMGLTPSTAYSYTVLAYDAAGNESGQSSSVSATTQALAPSTDTSVIDNLRSGQWFEVPNSQVSTVAPSPLPPGRLSSVIDAWSGGAYDTTRDRLIVWGGGHGDYGGNEIYTFNVNSLTWSRPWGPSPSIPDPLGAPCYTTYADGNPVSRHTYSGLQYALNVDKFWIQGGSLACGGGGAGFDTWTFDFNALKWTQKKNIPQTQLGVQTAYDPVTGHIFEQSMTKFFEYDPVGDTWTQRGDVGGDLGERNRTAVIDPVNRYFISMGDGQFFVWDLRTFRYFTPVTLGVSNLQSARAPGLDYDPVSKKIILWKGGTDVYSLDTSTWTWARIAAASTNTVTPTAPTPTGTFGRFRYVPSKNEFILVNSVYGNVYIYKLSEGTGL